MNFVIILVDHNLCLCQLFYKNVALVEVLDQDFKRSLSDDDVRFVSDDVFKEHIFQAKIHLEQFLALVVVLLLV